MSKKHPDIDSNEPYLDTRSDPKTASQKESIAQNDIWPYKKNYDKKLTEDKDQHD